VDGERKAAIWGGCVGAMAMTGVRQVTTGLGLLREAPPDQLARHGAPGLFGRIPPAHRPAVVQLLHLGAGMALGGVYASLPERLRRHRLTGPVYGLAAWAGFEAAAPLLGLPHAEHPRPVDRVALAADHELYGFVVGRSDAAGRPRPGD
jgi:hypothetical protein